MIRILLAVLVLFATSTSAQVQGNLPPSYSPLRPNSSGGGIAISTLNSTYLRLDTTNDPLTGTLRSVDGAVGAPAFSFTSVTNAGMYWTGSGLAFSQAGVERLAFNATEAVFNEGGVDYDLRVESDNLTHLIFADASSDEVGIGTSTTTELLTVARNFNGDTAIAITNTNAGSAAEALISISNTSSSVQLIKLGASWTAPSDIRQPSRAVLLDTSAAAGMAVATTGGGPLVFYSGSTLIALNAEAQRITATEVAFNDASRGLDFRIESDTDTEIFFVDASTNRIGVSTTAPASMVEIAGGTLTISGATTDITAASGEDLRLVGGATTGSLQFQSNDNLIDILNASAASTGFIDTQVSNIVRFQGVATGTVGSSSARANTEVVGGVAEDSTNWLEVYGSGVERNTPGTALALTGASSTVTSLSCGTSCNMSTNNAGGTAYTPSETGTQTGMHQCATNTGTETITMTEVSGQYEGTCAVGQWDQACWRYVVDRWVQQSCMDN